MRYLTGAGPECVEISAPGPVQAAHGVAVDARQAVHQFGAEFLQLGLVGGEAKVVVGSETNQRVRAAGEVLRPALRLKPQTPRHPYKDGLLDALVQTRPIIGRSLGIG